MKVFTSAVIVLLICISSAQAQATANSYEKCVAAIEVGDIDEVRSLAAIIETKLNLTSDNLENAKKCLEAAYDDVYEYHPDSKKWVKGAKAIELRKMIAARAEENRIKVKQNQLKGQRRCLLGKIGAIEDIEKFIFDGLHTQNKKIIETKTLNACIELNNADPNAAILNPVCREAFTQKLHPDVETQDLAKQFQELASEKVMAQYLLVENSDELAKLDTKKSTSTAEDKSVWEQAFKTCE